MWPLVIIGGVSLFFAGKYLKDLSDAGKGLLVDIVGAKYNGIKDGRIGMDLNLQFSNPVKQNLNLQFVMLDIFIGDTKIAEVRKDNLKETLILEGRKTITAPFPVQSIPLVSLLLSAGMTIKNMIATNTTPKELKIIGTIGANNFKTDFNKIIPFK